MKHHHPYLLPSNEIDHNRYQIYFYIEIDSKLKFINACGMFQLSYFNLYFCLFLMFFIFQCNSETILWHVVCTFSKIIFGNLDMARGCRNVYLIFFIISCSMVHLKKLWYFVFVYSSEELHAILMLSLMILYISLFSHPDYSHDVWYTAVGMSTFSLLYANLSLSEIHMKQ